MEPIALMQSYGITVPYKVDHAAPSGIVYLASHILAQADTSKKAASGFFAWCCESIALPDTAQNVETGKKAAPVFFSRCCEAATAPNTSEKIVCGRSTVTGI